MDVFYQAFVLDPRTVTGNPNPTVNGTYRTTNHAGGATFRMNFYLMCAMVVELIDQALLDQIGVFSPVTVTELLSDPDLSQTLPLKLKTL